jgi:phage tail-like protein
MAEVEAQAQPGTTVDPLRAFRFTVEVPGIGQGSFTSVSGIGVQVEAIKYREGGGDVTPRFIPGQVDYSEITFKYGLTTGDRMWDWLMAGANGQVDRRDISIIMKDPTGADEVLRWNCLRAWATRWEGGVLDAMSKELAIESMTIVYEKLERDARGAPAEAPPAGAPGT